MIKISKSEYIELLVASETLNRLGAGGVDNWEWYSESLNPDGEPDMDEFQAATAERVNQMEQDPAGEAPAEGVQE